VLASLRPDGGDATALAGESFQRHLRHWDEHGFGHWAVVEGETDAVIGGSGAAHPTSIPALADGIEVGWVLRRPYGGRGLATEAARAAIETAHAYLDPPGLISLIHPNNERSISVARRLGMIEAGEAVHPELGVPLRVYERRTRQRTDAPRAPIP
jgi:RimJ/RimL family protein N-acetyltransferase